MAPTKKAPPAEDETKTQEQEQDPDDDAASSDEAKAQEQRGDETPDPLDGVTFQQLQEYPRFQEDWENLTAAQKEEREKAYRDGQSAGAKQADEKTREYAARQEVIETFDDLERKRLSQDPDEVQEYANAMGNPKAKEAYERGRSAKQGPGAEEIATNAVGAAMTEVYQPLKQHPLLKDMTEEEHAALREEVKDQPQPFTTLAKKYCELIIERGTAASRIADDAKQLKDATEQGRRDAYDEMGLNYPGPEIEGGGAPPGRKLPTKEELGGKSTEEIAELERTGDLDKILAGRK